MVNLEHVSTHSIRTELARVESKKAALRLVVALNFKHGLTQTEIAAQYGVTRKTVYNWLTRIETQPLSDAITDDARPGRPPKLSRGQRGRLEAVLQESPTSVGYDAERWTPSLVRAFVEAEFDVEYSLPHVRRLMAAAGLTPADTAWVTDEASTPSLEGPAE